MGKRQINATEWSCDAPTCEVVEMVPQPATGPPNGWLSGTAEKDHLGPVDWVVHASKCTKAAIEHRLDELNQEAGEPDREAGAA